MDKSDETDLSAAVERRTTIHRGRVFRLDREELALANGTTVGLDVIRHPGAAAIVMTTAATISPVISGLYSGWRDRSNVIPR